MCKSTILLANNSAVDSISKNDRIAIELAEIWGLDQGVRQNIELFYKLDKAFINKLDSMIFDKTIDFIKEYGWVTDLGKYDSIYSYLPEVLYAVMLHNPHRLIDSSIYELLKNEVKARRLNPQWLIIFLDKYYVIYEKRTLYNSSFKQWLEFPYLLEEDKVLSDSLMNDIGLKALPDSLFLQNITQ